jgi:hypothetical protein
VKRLSTIKGALQNFSASVVNLSNQFDSLHKIIDLEVKNIDPQKDIQTFIARYSSFSENDRLRSLYKELGLYVPLKEET